MLSIANKYLTGLCIFRKTGISISGYYQCALSVIWSYALLFHFKNQIIESSYEQVFQSPGDQLRGRINNKLKYIANVLK